jgi:hypothetical protein
MIIAGILSKTYVTRNDADGQSTHIFNPSFIVLYPHPKHPLAKPRSKKIRLNLQIIF